MELASLMRLNKDNASRDGEDIQYVDRSPTCEVLEMLFLIDFLVRIRGMLITSLSHIWWGMVLQSVEF